MTHYIQAIPLSANKKLGGMPAVSSDSTTCPDRCKLKHPVRDPATGKTRAPACYGKHGPLGLAWRKLDAATQAKGNLLPSAKLPAWIGKHLHKGQLWRDRVVGDQFAMPHAPDLIDPMPLRRVHAANRKVGARGFGYTHHSMHVPENRAIVLAGYDAGYVLNASADGLGEAFALKDAYPRLAIAAAVPSTETRRTVKVGDKTAVMCPNVYNAAITCRSCGACAVPSRASVIMFPAHGTAKRSLDIIASDRPA